MQCVKHSDRRNDASEPTKYGTKRRFLVALVLGHAMEKLFNESKTLDDISQGLREQLSRGFSGGSHAHQPTCHRIHPTLLGVGSMVVTHEVQKAVSE